ncbi:hypothetical protein [Methylomusa anaerophila]|uniref:hypothetical protein n=1 Tax=Methylomusa anaerophila TaxID=1930071 RepID=UPI001E49E71E|nr:hypothetical protein [Methylomusa anaerophila]
MQKFGLVLLVIGLVYGAWRLLGAGQEAPGGQIEFTRQGVEITFDREQQIRQIRVRDKPGETVIASDTGPGGHKVLPVFIPWRPGHEYEFEICLRDGGKIRLSARSPDKPPATISFFLQAPYGLNSEENVGLVTNGSTFAINLLITNHADQKVGGILDVSIPPELEVAAVPPVMRLERRDGVNHVLGPASLTAENEIWNEQIQVKAGEAGRKATITARLHLDNGREQREWDKQAVIQISSLADISNNVKVAKVDLPVDASGRLEPKVQTGALAYQPPSRLLQFFTGEREDRRFDEDPLTFAAIRISNDGDQQVLALVTAKMTDIVTGKMSPAFTAPQNKNGGLGYSYGIAAVPAHSSNQVILPIYLDENRAVAGKYELQTETRIFGVSQVVSTSKQPVTLTVHDNKPLYATLFMTLVAVLGVSWFVWRQESALRRVSSKEMVIVALFGTVTFVTVNLPATVLMDIAHVIFGPFSFLFTGFFSQTVLYALMVALAVVLPRPGAVSLMIVVRFILNGFIFGHFSPMNILLYAALAVFLEAGLFFTGVTRGRGCRSRLSIVILAVVCGVVDIITSYMSMMAYMMLYRLYYADWYIWTVLAAGFVYCAIGAAIGCRLGDSLKRTAMD